MLDAASGLLYKGLMSKTYQSVVQIFVRRNFRAGLLRMPDGGTVI